jgi:hypothetical protein
MIRNQVYGFTPDCHAYHGAFRVTNFIAEDVKLKRFLSAFYSLTFGRNDSKRRVTWRGWVELSVQYQQHTWANVNIKTEQDCHETRNIFMYSCIFLRPQTIAKAECYCWCIHAAAVLYYFHWFFSVVTFLRVWAAFFYIFSLTYAKSVAINHMYFK